MSMFHDRRLYETARRSKRSGCRLRGPLRQLRDWVCEKYSVNVLHVEQDTLVIGPNKSRPRVHLIVETKSDFETLHRDRFSLKRNVGRNLKKKHVEFAGLEAESDPLVIVDDFSEEALARAISAFLRCGRRAVRREFADLRIWKISGFSIVVVVFYSSEEDVRIYGESGASERVAQRCRELIAKHDEFGYADSERPELRFDSKENLDRNYEGSLFYYWR